MSPQAWARLVCCTCFAALLVASCGESERDPRAGASGNAGAEEVAGEADTGAADNLGGARSPSGAPQSPAPASALGRACSGNDDCGGLGLTCLREDEDYPSGTVFALGAPGGGLCTAQCQTDDDCAGFGDGAVCAGLDEAPASSGAPRTTARRLCMRGCTFGLPIGEQKCGGRKDLACRPFSPVPTTLCPEGDECEGGTFCFRGACRLAACGPRCNTDMDCAKGRYCNPSSGLCDAVPPTPVPIGAACDPDVPSNVCGSGTCLVLFDENRLKVTSFCSQTCTMGTACGEDGACVLDRLENGAAGDIAHCAQRCDCDSDCRNPNDRCAAWSTERYRTHFKSAGYCEHKSRSGGGIPCGSGGAGGATGIGGAASSG